MRAALSVFLVTTLILGQRGVAAAEVASDNARNPRAVVQAMFDAFNRHDPQAMRALYHADAILTSTDFCAPRRRVDVVRTYAELFARFPTLFDQVELLVVEGDWVAVRFLAKSSASANEGLKIMGFMRIKDGLIIEDDVVFNPGNMACSP